MTHADEPLTDEQVAQHVPRALSEREEVCRKSSACACRSDVQELLETLVALGHVEGTEEGAFMT